MFLQATHAPPPHLISIVPDTRDMPPLSSPPPTLQRSEIRVDCANFLACHQVVEQISESFQDQRHHRSKNNRQALRLQLEDHPLDSSCSTRSSGGIGGTGTTSTAVSDGELDTADDSGGSADQSPYFDEKNRSNHDIMAAAGSAVYKHRSYVEISPTDSAFHSEDRSPDSSRFEEDDDDDQDHAEQGHPSSHLSYCCDDNDLPDHVPPCGWTSLLSERRTSLLSKRRTSLLSERRTSLLSENDDSLRDEGACGGLFATAGSLEDADYAALQLAQPWWESNWSLHSEQGVCGAENQWRGSAGSLLSGRSVPAVLDRFVPLVIPVPDRCVKPRIGPFDIDDVSELSDVRSVASEASYNSNCSGDSESTLEDLSFLAELKDCRIGVGQVARFRCQLLGQRAVTVTWHHGSRIVENGGRYRIYRYGSKHILEIYFTTFADSGAVVCRAMGVDTVAETRARLRIRESRLAPRAPEFIYKLESVEVAKGEDVELSCRVRGHPVPVLTWFLNGRKVTGMDIGIEVEHVGKEEWLLMIEGNRLLSSSTVRCLASNPVGECLSSASILLLSAAGELKPNANVSVDRKLANLDRKLSQATNQVLESAQSMLSDANQMASLDRQLKVVDTYLDRIEAKFRQTDSPVPPAWLQRHKPASPSPPQLSLIEVTFPSRDVADSSTTSPFPLSSRVSAAPAKASSPSPSSSSVAATAGVVARHYQPRVPKPQSVSITVLSKHIQSDRVRVVFKQSFDSEASAPIPVVPSVIVSPSTRPVSSASSSMGTTTTTTTHQPQPPAYQPAITVSSSYPSPGSNFASTVHIGDGNPYSSENLSRRIAEKQRLLNSGVAASGIAVPDSATLEDPLSYRPSSHIHSAYSRDYIVNSPVAKPNEAAAKKAIIQADDTINRTTDRLHHLDNRIGLLQTDLLTVAGDDHHHRCRPEDLKRLDAAVHLTASEIQATERTIKQVESLVTHLQHQQQQQSVKRPRHRDNRSPLLPLPPSEEEEDYSHSSRDHRSHVLILPSPSPSPTPPIVTYSNMSSTPLDFPQDGPSVKNLLSRFQNERRQTASANGTAAALDNAAAHRRIGSTTSEDGSDLSVRSSPDAHSAAAHHKPLNVFSKTKFQETVMAARSQGKPRIQASITARSLSREMREQLRISKPQMGAFRSNIMTAENGEYDPEKALKAKTLFIAESVHEHDLQDSQKAAANRSSSVEASDGRAVITTNGTVEQFHHVNGGEDSLRTDDHGHHQEAFDEGLDVHSEAGDDVKSLGGGGVRDSSGSHGVRQMNDSGHYDVDSLDEDAEVEVEEEQEPQYASITKKDGGALQEPVKSRSGSAGSGRHHDEKTAADEKADSHSIGGDSVDSGAGLSSGTNKKWSPQPPADEEGDNIPLSQAPNWDLLI
ncbi:hypothetical protein BV898_04729 [Hypsibius exemplaris]|uniref:Ig-like domain-containing protein n=1 Tax=Hypsibius exemplaris TaxID=2072580 RepID=A0A1W0X1Q3_HYPEX|nr:hypothetical protein BV898_04729 [Hypsibius exemplaris]